MSSRRSSLFRRRFGHRDTLALPYYGWRLTASKPKPGYTKEFEHLGDHIRKRRIDLGLNRKELARQLGTNGWTMKHWEEHLKSRIEIRFYPAIIAFLGHNPLPEPKTRGQAIRRGRHTRGWSRARLAKAAGVDEGTIQRLENDRKGMAKKSAQAICKVLGIAADPNKTGDQ
jgi:ribosome-binding protein aMBF1 (putative translation factor)